jgi:hypothetical protein
MYFCILVYSIQTRQKPTENRALSRIFGTDKEEEQGIGEILHTEELHNLKQTNMFRRNFSAFEKKVSWDCSNGS